MNAHFLLVYNCKKNGDTYIRVIMDFENYKVVEFTYKKQCLVHTHKVYLIFLKN